MSTAPHRIRLQLERPGFALSLDLDLPGDGITVLFGPSGSGKTTVLRCIAGLERARGQVRIAGEDWQDDAARRFVPPWRRPLGYVFQEASLFPHLDVAGNLRFASRRAGPAPAGAPALASIVALLGIGHLLARTPEGLSGGERQRVAIARALATHPRLLLLDEPLAALDAARRREVLPWLERLRDELRIPMVYVTHGTEEMTRLADTLVLLEQGHVQAAGPLADTLSRLDLPAAAGEAQAVLPGRIDSVDARWALARVAFDGGALWLPDAGLPVGTAVRVRLLARDVSLALAPPPPGTSTIQNLLAATVLAVAPAEHPSQVRVQLALGPHRLLANVTARAADALALAPGQPLWAQVKSAALVR
jgi:molybdate transport system ATP-binding protein